MNFDELLTKILEIANYPQDQRQEFKDTFYSYYLSKLVDDVGQVDADSAKKLAESIQVGEKEYQVTYESLVQNDAIGEVVDKVNDEVIGQMVDDVSKYSSEEQKRQILAILPTQ